MIRRYLFALALLSSVSSAQLARPKLFKEALAERVARLKDYTCTVTIERFHKKPRKAALENTDRVRLEVAFVENRELFGWPGGGKIDEADVGRLVGGTIGNGDFALQTRALLLVPDDAFVAVPGDPRFQFSVPAAQSDWMLQTQDGTVQAGYRGIVWFERDSYGLFKQEVTASGSELGRLGFERVVKTLQYRMVRDPNGIVQLLPESAQLRILETNGVEATNVSSFDQCRLFGAESKLLAEAPQPGASDSNRTAVAAKNDSPLPAEFQIPLELTSVIDSNTSAVGDLVTLRAADSVQQRGQILIQKGDLATARISRLELSEGRRYLEFVLLSIESQGKRLSLEKRNNFIGRMTDQVEFRAKMAAEARPTASSVGSSSLGPIVAKARLELPPGSRLILRSTAR